MTSIEELIGRIDELLKQLGTGQGINPPYPEPTPKSVRDFYTKHAHLTDNKLATISGMFGMAEPTRDRPAKFMPIKVSKDGHIQVDGEVAISQLEGDENEINPLHVILDEFSQISNNFDFEEEQNNEWVGGKWVSFGLGGNPILDDFSDDRLIPILTPSEVETAGESIYIADNSTVGHDLSRKALVFDYTQAEIDSGFVVYTRSKKAVTTGVPIQLSVLFGVVNEDGAIMPELVENLKFSIGFILYDQHDNVIERINSVEYPSLYDYTILNPLLPESKDVFVASPQPPVYNNRTVTYIPRKDHAVHYVRPFISVPQIGDTTPKDVAIFIDQVRLIRGNIFEPIYKRYIAGDFTQFEDIDEEEGHEKEVELAFGNGFTLMVESQDNATDIYYALSHDRENWFYPDEYHFQTADNPDGFGLNAYAMVNVEYRAKWLKIFTSSNTGTKSDVRIALVETQEE